MSFADSLLGMEMKEVEVGGKGNVDMEVEVGPGKGNVDMEMKEVEVGPGKGNMGSLEVK